MWMPPSALFPHRQRLAPRGFVLPRFVNVDRHHPAATVALRSTSKNLQGSGLSRVTLILGQYKHDCRLHSGHAMPVVFSNYRYLRSRVVRPSKLSGPPFPPAHDQLSLE